MFVLIVYCVLFRVLCIPTQLLNISSCCCNGFSLLPTRNRHHLYPSQPCWEVTTFLCCENPLLHHDCHQVCFCTMSHRDPPREHLVYHMVSYTTQLPTSNNDHFVSLVSALAQRQMGARLPSSMSPMVYVY